VRGSFVEDVFVNRIGNLIGENARAEAGHSLLDVMFVASQEHIIVHVDVVQPEVYLERHVAEKTSDEGGQMQHVRRFDTLEELIAIFLLAQIAILAPSKIELALQFESINDLFYALSKESGTTRHQDDVIIYQIFAAWNRIIVDGGAVLDGVRHDYVNQ